jgi:hypothetical protein
VSDKHQGKVYAYGDFEALVLSDTKYDVGQSWEGYPAIVVNRVTRLRAFPTSIPSRPVAEGVSLISPEIGWTEQEHMVGLRDDLGTMGLIGECLVTYPRWDTMNGALCPCCGEKVQFTCCCDCCDECGVLVEDMSTICDDCLEHATWCDVCDERTDHDNSSHDFCDKCDDYAAHCTEDHEDFCEKCNEFTTHSTEEHEDDEEAEDDAPSDSLGS